MEEQQRQDGDKQRRSCHIHFQRNRVRTQCQQNYFVMVRYDILFVAANSLPIKTRVSVFIFILFSTSFSVNICKYLKKKILKRFSSHEYQIVYNY